MEKKLISDISAEKTGTTIQHPFIIWTFRRSGGTNLGQALFRESPFDTVEHEPFNIDRVFGDVIRDWNENKDEGALNNTIEKILSQKILIKHCLEIMPSELNLALLNQSVKHGYKHIFLYREYPTDRLLSLNFAKQSNIWGKEHKKTRPLNEDIFKNSMPTTTLLDHESDCRRKMTHVYNELVKQNQKPLAVSFESLYQSPFEYSSKLVQNLFESLSLGSSVVTNVFLNKMLKLGGQGTKNEYLRFKGADEFVKKSDALPRFKLYSTPDVSVECAKGDDIIHFEAWKLVPSLNENEYMLSGVLLSADPDMKRIVLMVGSNLIETEWSLKSERIQKLFPELKRAAQCRYLSTPFTVDGVDKLMISLSR